MIRPLFPSRRFINKVCLQKLNLRIPNIPESLTSTTKPIIPDSTLSIEERSSIIDSDFVKGLYTPKTQDHDISHIPPKVQAISKYIPLIHGDLLSYHRPSTTPTPFEIIQIPGVERPQRGHTPISEFPRLSVTKVLTKQWCELRDFFEIYSRIPREVSSAMKAGTKSHLALELKTHPEIDLDSIRKNLPRFKLKKVDLEVRDRVQDIVRMIDLLTKGRAREIYIHGFIDEFGIVDHYNDINDDKIIVTGIIDHLVLLAKDPTRPLETDFRNLGNDMKNLVDNGPEIVGKYLDSYFLLISDVKTRSRNSLPTQESVLQSAKDQVMIYRKFLQVLGKMGIPWLEEYFSRKNVDIDEPISPEFTIELISTYDIFHKDFERLRDGKPIGFKHFDQLNSSKQIYDLSHLKSKITNPETLMKLSPFLVPWLTPLTTRYFITRLSQIFHIVSLLLRTPQLRIEYLYNDNPLQNISFEYDEKHIMNTVSSGFKFWTGKRDPIAVEGGYKEITSICKFCEFKENCSWTKEIEANNYQYGMDSIH